jgi:hypothetical protein
MKLKVDGRVAVLIIFIHCFDALVVPNNTTRTKKKKIGRVLFICLFGFVDGRKKVKTVKNSSFFVDAGSLHFPFVQSILFFLIDGARAV